MKLILIIALLCINNFSAPAGETKLCAYNKICSKKEEPKANLPLMPSILIVDIY